MIKNRLATIAAPIALVGALMFTGCTGTAGPAGVVEPTGTGITDVAKLQNNIDTWDEILDEELNQLSLDLNANAAEGVKEINLLSYGADQVTVNILTADEEGVVGGDQLRAVIETLKTFAPSQPIASFVITGWDQNFYQGDSEQAAVELGLDEEFIDTEWHNIEFPADQLTKLLA